ncbi:hypothetical protein E2986_08393 [Frieseomelitta varia]|uniref:MaoC-like domain-containing protein n=1 Tax=Frieseomelitta varia TaxID=561572 RepID=A0A833WCH9_9HYME|nr:hypothetical protein E2986_08393 [Frieseomelitta varia]
MFSSKKQLIKRTGKNPVGRYDFLKLLATEFQTTKSKEAREQVLANLANFAYDPINYGYIRQLQIIDLFLHTLSENNIKLVRFAAAAICNLCADPINKLYILRNQGIHLLTSLLSSQDEDTVLSAITSLIFLLIPDYKNEVTAELIEKISGLSNCENNHDILNFAKLTGDYNPIHFEASNNLVHGALLNGLVSGVIGTKMPGPGTVVIGQSFTFPAPCYAGDTIEIKVQIISARKIMKCEYICIANEKKIVLKGNATFIKRSLNFEKGNKEPPKGNPAIFHNLPGTFPCTPSGNRLCTNKCLDMIIKYLPNSSKILCSSIKHNCHKEKAYLFIKNCKSGWINTNLSAGREYCCKGGTPYKCPV